MVENASDRHVRSVFVEFDAKMVENCGIVRGGVV